jgi:hypothetical protein
LPTLLCVRQYRLIDSPGINLKLKLKAQLITSLKQACFICYFTTVLCLLITNLYVVFTVEKLTTSCNFVLHAVEKHEFIECFAFV